MTNSKQTRANVGESWAAWLLLLPAIILLVVVRLLPIANAIWGSLLEPIPGGAGGRLGFGNYVFLFTRYPDFLKSLFTTMVFVVLAGTVQAVSALVMAVLFARGGRGVGIMRTIVLLPLMVPVAASAGVWGVIFQPEGPFNAILEAIGLPAQPLLTTSSQALFCVVVIVSWGVAGYWMTVLAAGINDIPRSLYEAAEIDGANSWQSFWSITIPMLRRPLAFVLVASTVGNFLAFAPVQILTKGGPSGSTNLVLYEIYTQAYANYDMGLATAEVVLCLIVLGAVVAMQFRLLASTE